MKNRKSNLFQRVLVIITIVAFAIVVIRGLSKETVLSGGTSDQIVEEGQVQEQVYTFRTDEYREEHFTKHGMEFSYLTPKEYEQGANKVINNSDSLHRTEVEDGDDVYYLEITNELVIVSVDGYIRTYFKPDNGIDYYNRQ